MEEKVSFSIRTKLCIIYIAFTTLLFGASFFLISFFSTKLSIKKSFAENEAINSRTLNGIQTVVLRQQEETANLFLSADYLSLFSSETFEAEFFTFLENFFTLNKSVLFVYDENYGIRINQQNLNKTSTTESYFSLWASSAEEGLHNLSSYFQHPVTASVFSYKKNNSLRKMAVAFSSKNLVSLLGTGSLNSSLLLNSKGQLLISSDIEETLSEADKSGFSCFEKALSSSEKYFQFMDYDESNLMCLFNSAKSGTGKDSVLITKIPLSKATDSTTRTQFLVILLYIITLSLGILILRSFSARIISKLEYLIEAFHFIEAGKFNIELHDNSKDELSAVLKTFNKMAYSLEDFKDSNRIKDRKNVKTNVSFPCTVMKIKLENYGTLDDCTSKKSFSELLNIWNETISKCIQKGKGRIMLQNQTEFICNWADSDFENSSEEAAWNALKTAFFLRYEFFLLNKIRKEKQMKNVRINIGLSTGNILLKTSEYSENENLMLDGQAVIFASFAAELNKIEKSDIIIENSTAELIKDKIIFEKIPEEFTEFAAQKYFAVINALNMKGPQNLIQLKKALF